MMFGINDCAVRRTIWVALSRPIRDGICFVILLFFLSVISGGMLHAQSTCKTTYCNPIDIDYTYMSHYRARTNVSYRSGADPAVVNFKGQYYMFVTRSHGYWSSDDL